jgi:hypothetical protein
LEGESVIWLTRIALASIVLAALSFVVVFYQQESATKYVMMDAPTMLVKIEFPPTATRTPTATPRPTLVPTIQPTPWPVYGLSSPQAVMLIPKWTPTSIVAATTEPEHLLPCVTVTPDQYADVFCEVTDV